MTRFAEKFGANKNTLFGLSGLGDLILTCGSNNSRNTKFGIKIASSKYENFSDLLVSQEVTEGYYTVEAVYNIAKDSLITEIVKKTTSAFAVALVLKFRISHCDWRIFFTGDRTFATEEETNIESVSNAKALLEQLENNR